MVRRWLIYLATVIGCIVFYLAYQEWFSWFALICVLCLPIAALLMSLPAMTHVKLKAQRITAVPMGAPLPLPFSVYSRLPAPPCRYVIRVIRPISGESWLLKAGDKLPTQHCGKLICKPEKARVYDYLGLFRLKIQRKSSMTITVLPEPIPMRNIPDLQRYMAASWRPKPGGGFSENHEMRQYRPGDNLNQVHWKLTAKTGEIIVREPQEPERRRVLVEMELRGTAEELDRKFGQLLWLSNHLLETGLMHELRVLTGGGIRCLRVEQKADLESALDSLLGEEAAQGNEDLEPVGAAWYCKIGGGEDET